MAVKVMVMMTMTVVMAVGVRVDSKPSVEEEVFPVIL